MSELLLMGGASASSTFRVDLISVIGHTGVTSGVPALDHLAIAIIRSGNKNLPPAPLLYPPSRKGLTATES